MAERPGRIAQRVTLAALFVVGGLAAFGAIDPRHEVWIALAPDEAEHAAFAFLLAILALAAFPRVPLWAIVAPLATAGAGLELLQGAGLIAGQFELRDAGANVLGVAAALIAHGCVCARQAGRTTSPPSVD